MKILKPQTYQLELTQEEIVLVIQSLNNFCELAVDNGLYDTWPEFWASYSTLSNLMDELNNTDS